MSLLLLHHHRNNESGSSYDTGEGGGWWFPLFVIIFLIALAAILYFKPEVKTDPCSIHKSQMDAPESELTEKEIGCIMFLKKKGYECHYEHHGKTKCESIDWRK